ncbi:hypothetical protein E8E13_005756 [Curvularia kusanoi]|uniref:Transferase family protein n=1 Tax=Curvularia kusanoi TaxID=90978 RepID=A0A9P4W8D0_CURKU|nr:hypothetical protein E8E13_005756 [Curvularia kusanoi]
MASMEALNEPRIIRQDRVQPERPAKRESVSPLSLLDATTANFALTSAVWLFERPSIALSPKDLPNRLRTALRTALNAYPQWCGFLKSINSVDIDSVDPETTSFPLHARRYGRVYIKFGATEDPGVEFVEATSAMTVDDLYSMNSAERRPIWNRQGPDVKLSQFVPLTTLANALQLNEKDEEGLYRPIMAVQCTQLTCGGFILAVKIAHPLADITALTHFVRDWASVSKAMLEETSIPVLTPVFDPLGLDGCAAGDINADGPDSALLHDAAALPMHRYDWWAPPAHPPPPFPADLPLAGKPLPWAEWDTKASVDQYTIHFDQMQVDYLWRMAMQVDPEESSGLKISKHDALLAHVWSCVVRARNLQDDSGLVHCDLTLGTRPAFQLTDSFIGSPVIMLNISLPALQVSARASVKAIANSIRQALTTVNDAKQLGAHLHSVAYEKSPQRIWQAFLGQRHVLVTTWARAGIYEVDFGLRSRIRYADGVVPCLDGCILINEGPPSDRDPGLGTAKRGWTDDGVDITLPLRSEDMQRLLKDPLLLPQL